MSAAVTPLSHPDLPWQRLVGGPYNYPHVAFAVLKTPRAAAPAQVYAYSYKNGFAYHRPCNQPDRAVRWAIYFAQHHAG